MYGHDYREVAQWNGIAAPYAIHKGQRLRVVPGGVSVAATTQPIKPSFKPVPTTEIKKPVTPQVSEKYSADNKSISWQWPVRGKVLNYFASSKLNKGIDIGGKRGQPIYAAASGKVVYSGTGLVGMGKLIIINHSSQYLSAYAHNEKILVKEGQQLKKGALIAQMGSSGSDAVMLHFEIRREGKPVNPLNFLPKSK